MRIEPVWPLARRHAAVTATGGLDAAQWYGGRATGGTSGSMRRIQIADTRPATTAKPALTQSTLPKPSSSVASSTASPAVNPATTGIAATATRLPVRATALLTPDAMPARCADTELSAVVVNGATVNVRPTANTRMPGNTASA